jgi:hypothetical protein
MIGDHAYLEAVVDSEHSELDGSRFSRLEYAGVLKKSVSCNQEDERTVESPTKSPTLDLCSALSRSSYSATASSMGSTIKSPAVGLMDPLIATQTSVDAAKQSECGCCKRKQA